MTIPAVDMKALVRRTYQVGLGAILVLSVIFFVPAGTLAYWQAWVYMGILLTPMIFVVRYLLRHSPHLLERRFQIRERETTQKRLIGVSLVYFVLAFILPGLDRRWGWSAVPVWVVLAADLVVLISYALIVRVFVENPYASRTVEVASDQKVVSTGLYSVVRHPMYVGAMFLYLASPIALGSWWAFLPAALVVPTLIIRILNEEQVLQRDLPGYREYMQKTKYRLLPGIW